MEYLFDYLLFLAQAVTVVVAVGLIIVLLASVSMRGRAAPAGHLEVTRLNDEMEDMRDALRHVTTSPRVFKAQKKAEDKARSKQEKQQEKQAAKAAQGNEAAAPLRPRLFVLDFDGDIQASAVENLRREVNGLLLEAKPGDQVLLRLESPGGMVHGYGLAAAQLERIRRADLELIVAVDKVAASGGYLMACLANRIIAAPFAILGSIGVIAQIPNVHRLLKANRVDVEVLTAGEFKRTLTTVGENTEKGRAKFVEELEDVHSLFKDHVHRYRPSLDLQKVATGEAWHGHRALENGLVDELTTSDEFLLGALADRDAFALRWRAHKNLVEQLSGGVEQSLSGGVRRALEHWLSKDPSTRIQ